MRWRNRNMTRTVEEYLELGYPVELRRNPDGSYFAEHPDLPGCMTEADTPNDAVASLAEAAKDWIQDRLARGLNVPEPVPEESYSGKFVVRLPSSLHGLLARRASREDTSLNQLVVSLLSSCVGLETLQEPIRASLDGLRREMQVLISSSRFVPPTDYWRSWGMPLAGMAGQYRCVLGVFGNENASNQLPVSLFDEAVREDVFSSANTWTLCLPSEEKRTRGVAYARSK
jgi:antitoxin HicB